MKANELEIVSEKTFGEGGFLKLKRFGLRNIRGDGSKSESYTCDYAIRTKGISDAVVVVLCRKQNKKWQVLLREGIRPALSTGRPEKDLVVEEPRPPIYFTEVVAGVLETSDKGEKDLFKRAQSEVWEEAGYKVSIEDLQFLGAPTFAAPAVIPEKLFLFWAQIDDGVEQEIPPGDGSPMEEGAKTFWIDLDLALQRFFDGDYQDMKSELMLHRLKKNLDDNSTQP